ncbi:hypothetical protein PPERSA_02930 [Pseudocohnilembus persalinus]|uniref:G-patch domain-containing protein n=1 Tax=Pseudocohnilembus persalinus TaxID=266149 RepID=A0A0V0QAB9_PSEPJ|nr:hypothetical protein PPERSA_02930 [Pseudocohnilembus persalinus]|eukprot:KRW99098.1 hypothetical protein PPERSA_02930 [Pseudocohnilembus persalinus]
MEEEDFVIKDIDQKDRFDKDKFTGEDITLEAYDRISVDDFGTMALKKMGWREDKGIGKRKHVQDLILPKLRGHRQGLGADPIPQIKDKKQINKEKREQQQDITGQNKRQQDEAAAQNKFGIKNRMEVFIVSGEHEGLKGIVTSVNNDRNECNVELKNGVTLRISLYDVQDVEKRNQQIKELEQMKNKDKKSKKDKKKKKRSKSSDSDNSDNQGNNNNSRSRSRSGSNKKKEAKTRNPSSSPENKKSKKKKEKKPKKEKKEKKLKWVLPKIRVKIISKELENLYNTKAVIQDVLSEKQFQIISEKGDILDDLKEKDIQTVLPSVENTVLIVGGEFRGKKAILKSRDKKQNTVIIMLTEPPFDLLQCTQDDVCEYVNQ